MRVLVADDSILFRRVLVDVLSSLPDVEVVGTAANGRIALNKVLELKPDLLTLDIEMPELDGLSVLDSLARSGNKVEVIVLSGITASGSDLTMRALQRGAFDFVVKPDSTNAEQARSQLTAQLAPRIRAIAHRLEIRSILRCNHSRDTAPIASSDASAPEQVSTLLVANPVATRMDRVVNPVKPDLVLIGVSTGGPAALSQLLPRIPSNLGVPILVVQHMPPAFTRSLAESLAEKCTVNIQEAAHGQLIQANDVYIAPGGRQMRIETRGAHTFIELTDDPPENNCRPAVDYLFRSVANEFPGRAMAVILTGMGNDGTLGLRLLKRRGCFVIAQDEQSCVVYGMPRSAVEAGVVDVVLPLDEIADRISAAVMKGRA